MFSYLSRVLRVTPSLPLAHSSLCLPQCVPDRESPRFINEKCKSFFVYFFFLDFQLALFCVWFFVRVAHIRDRGNVAGEVGGQGSHGRRASLIIKLMMVVRALL